MDLHRCGNPTENVLITLAVFMRSFEQRIKDNFQQKCFSEINISKRCILYKAIDCRFEMAKYILCMHINSNGKALCWLCLSSHRL